MTNALTATTLTTTEQVPERPWRLFVAATRTGQIVASVPFVGVPRWEYRLNTSGGLTCTVPLDAIDKADLDELCTPWRWSWGLAWGAHIVQAGPVVTDRYTDQEGPPTVDIGCGGLWHLLWRRVLVNPSWAEGQDVASPLADVVLTGRTLRQIAADIVSGDLSRTGHSLPIALPAADPAGAHERTYPGYDLAMVGERLLQLTQVIDGPEVEFRPRFTTEAQTAMEWEMRAGSPRLGQLGYPHAYDYGQALTHVDYDRDGSAQTFGHFERGNGTERGLLTGYQDDKTLISLEQYPWPDLESVGMSSTSDTDAVNLQSKAEGHLVTNSRPIVTWSATVRIDGTNGRGGQTRSPSLDLIRAGDNAVFALRGHRRIADGTYQRRILGASSGATLDTAQLVLQPTT